MNKQIGLFFGSFNPIHYGHLMIASYMAHFTELEEVWFVVSPQNPFKEKKNLANMYDRLEMVNIAIENSGKLLASSIEFNLPKPSYTIDTLIHLKEKYPNRDFVLIMGEDNLASLEKWKNYEIILRDYKIFVYPRPNAGKSTLRNHPSVTVTDTPLIEISSTFIRHSIKNNKNVKYFTPDGVIDFIDKKGLYL